MSRLVRPGRIGASTGASGLWLICASYQRDRARQGPVVYDVASPVVGEHFNEKRDRVLGAIGNGKPRQGVVPRFECEQNEMMLLKKVGLLVRDDRAHLVTIEKAEESGGEHGGRTGRSRQTVSYGSRVIDDPHAGPVRQRVAEQSDEMVMSAPLALGSNKGCRQVQHEVGAEQERTAKREDVGEGCLGRECSVTEMAAQ